MGRDNGLPPLTDEILAMVATRVEPRSGRSRGDAWDLYNASNSRHYEYDRWYRLKGYWVSNGRSDPFSQKIIWSYDQYGNIISTTTWVDPNNCPYPEGCTTNFSINPATNRLTN